MIIDNLFVQSYGFFIKHENNHENFLFNTDLLHFIYQYATLTYIYNNNKSITTYEETHIKKSQKLPCRAFSKNAAAWQLTYQSFYSLFLPISGIPTYCSKVSLSPFARTRTFLSRMVSPLMMLLLRALRSLS